MVEILACDKFKTNRQVGMEHPLTHSDINSRYIPLCYTQPIALHGHRQPPESTVHRCSKVATYFISSTI